MAYNALAGAGVAVGVDETVGYGVVITGLQVIEAGFCVVVIATIVKVWGQFLLLSFAKFSISLLI